MTALLGELQTKHEVQACLHMTHSFCHLSMHVRSWLASTLELAQLRLGARKLSLPRLKLDSDQFGGACM